MEHSALFRKKSFDRVAEKYHDYSQLQRNMAIELDERLSFFNIKPSFILDLGSGTGYLSQLVKTRYPKAVIIPLDLSYPMLDNSFKQESVFPVVADAQKLPFKDKKFDLIISNAMLQWSPNLSELILEISSTLKNNALFIFATFGPDTLKEWRKSWLMVEQQYNHTNTFLDMHDIAENLLACNMKNPVVDIEKIEIEYDNIKELAKSIKGVGSRTQKNYRPGLTGKNMWNQLTENYPKNESGKLNATWEIIYGHCFQGIPQKAKHQSPFYIDANNISINS